MLTRGDSFGELALINDSCRSATIHCASDAQLWVLDRYIFQNTLKSLNKLNYQENGTFIDGMPMFELLNEIQIEQVISALVVQKFHDGTAIINEGDKGELLYIVKEG